MSKLHLFDMDGTLLHGAAVEAVSRVVGCIEEVAELERAHLRGEVSDDVAWWERVFALWAGSTDAEIDEAFDAGPWMDGIREVFADIAERGEHAVVISQSPHFLVRRLESRGAEATFGTGITRNGPVLNSQMLTARDKLTIAERLVADLGLTTSDCVAYGDGGSDIDLFGALANTVGVNPIPAVARLAARVYVGEDLREAYSIGRSLLDGAAAERASER